MCRVRPNALFDSCWYRSQINPAVAKNGSGASRRGSVGFLKDGPECSRGRFAFPRYNKSEDTNLVSAVEDYQVSTVLCDAIWT